MDALKAKKLLEKLRSNRVDGWQITDLCGWGKSAAVFKAEQSGSPAAIKVFDDELVERFGRPAQLARIGRELTLTDKGHQNLVRILGGGETKDGLLYVAMEFVDSPNLAQVLKEFPRTSIQDAIAQIASAAKFLEDNRLVHRDIKPDNIAISSDFSKCLLLDLGVMRPIGETDLTDNEQREFLGTLRYSSPEFLFREERDTVEGWRALTFYQIGAVLHDLIMRVRIFSQVDTPYARLVEAVKSDKPRIEAADVAPDLVLLAKNCLVKDPDKRLELVSWESFEVNSQKATKLGELTARIRKRQALAKASITEHTLETEAEWERRRVFETLLTSIYTHLRKECIGTDVFPPIECQQATDVPGGEASIELRFARSSAHGLQQPCTLYFRVRLVDLSEQVLEIVSGVRLLVHLHSQIVAPSATQVISVYKGVFDDTIIQQRLQEAIYRLWDIAQNHAESETPTTDDHWLPIEDD